ncbi:MAG: methionine synthase [Candidatus Aureabacteria bacterium]|nr:methionine synthase [Candidatus Auribacterota bacterium]
MNQIKYFESIYIPLRKEKIYKRLGYNKHFTRIDEKQKNQLEDYFEEALLLLELKGAAKRILIEKNNTEKISLSGNISFESKKLANFLEGSSEVLIMGATAGKKIMESIVKDSTSDNLTRGVVFDAVASEMVDDCFLWMVNYFNTELRRENRQLTKRRFSAGYGDFELKNQKLIYNILELNKLDITLSNSFILIPEKSVTAVAGIINIE